MAAKPIRIEAACLDLDRVRREIVGSASGDRLEAFRDAEPERELLVVTGRPHRDRDRLAVDADLERLLDRDCVALAASAGQAQRLDAVRRVRGCLGHADQRTRGESRGSPHVDVCAQGATAQTAKTVIDQLSAVAVTSRTLAR